MEWRSMGERHNSFAGKKFQFNAAEDLFIGWKIKIIFMADLWQLILPTYRFTFRFIEYIL